MPETQTQVNDLQDHIDQGAQQAKSYLSELEKKVNEFDKQNKYSTTAADFLKKGIQNGHESVDQLVNAGEGLKVKANEVSEESMKEAHKALENTKQSLDTLKSKAQEYDQKFLGKESADKLEDVVNSTRQRSLDAIELAGEQLSRVKGFVKDTARASGHGVQVAVGEAARLGEMADERMGVSGRVKGAVEGVVGRVKKIDEMLHASSAASKIDDTLAFGLGKSVVQKSMSVAQESYEYVRDTVNYAKLAAQKSESAQAVEQRVVSTADSLVCSACGARDQVVHLKDQLVCTACSAGHNLSEMGHRTKEAVVGTAEEKGGEAEERAASSLEETKNQGTSAMEKAKHKGEEVGKQAKGKASDVAEQTKKSGSDAMGKVGAGTEEAVAKGKQMGQGVKHSVQNEKDKPDTKHKGQDVQMRQHG